MGGSSDTEVDRLATLRALQILDTDPEESFERLARLAGELTGAPIALISLVDERRLWFKANVGLDGIRETPREHAFCAHAIEGDALFEVEDAAADGRFADNPLVTGPPNIRFYAGAPLVIDGSRVGTLCVIDSEPRALEERERDVLRTLSRSVEDLLEARRVALAAHRRLELLQLAEEVSGVGHWWHVEGDETGFWSPEIYRILGRDPETQPPRLEDGLEMYHPDDRERVRERVARAFSAREGFTFEARVVRPSGEIRWVRASGQGEVRGPGDDRPSTLGTFEDITEARQLERRVVQAEKLASLGTMAAGVAHEVNNPLSFVHMNAALLRDRLDDPHAPISPDELREVLDEILRGSDRIRRIVEGLRTFSKPDDFEPGPVDLREVAGAAVREVTHRLRHAEARVEVAGDAPTVMGDAAMLERLIVNLVVNADQAWDAPPTPPGQIVVEVGHAGEALGYVEVRDDGPGMPAEVLAAAPTPFFTTKPDGGTGLGLAICHGLVQAMHGELSIDSAPGEGTRVRATLPATDPAVPDDEPRRGRVLIVDDEPLVGKTLARVFSAHEVTLELDGGPALERIRGGETFDAILCDVRMPGMDGAELYSALAREHPEQARRMIFLTAADPSSAPVRLLREAGMTILDKPPPDLRQLYDTVGALLPGGAARRHRR